MCECCVRLDVGDESASLFVLSVCADGSVAWYLGCPGCFVELRFLHCDDVRFDVSSRCFSSSTVLLIPFALSCRIFISLCLVLFVFCLLCVWECAGVGTCGGLCGGEMRGE